jgi:hypothetical protein
MDLDDLQRSVFDGLYTARLPLAVAGAVTVAILAAVAIRRGWFAAARRHPARTAATLGVVMAVGLPLAWYVASPLVIRTELIEPAPIVAARASAAPDPVVATPPRADASSLPSTGSGSTGPTPSASTPFGPTILAKGEFAGTDDFHFGRGTASIIETAPGTYLLRLDDFSVRNGPDLFVYLSPDGSDYVDGALEIGRLKATDGAFGYELPPGTVPADFRSALIWCKQFSHLFAVAPLAVVEL